MARAVKTGTLTSPADTVVLTPLGDGYVNIQAYGTFSTAVLIFKAYVGSSAVYVPLQAFRTDGTAIESTTASFSTAVTWRANIGGYSHVEVYLSSIVSGSVSISMSTDNFPQLYSFPAASEGQSGLLYDNNSVLDTVAYAQATVTTGSTDTALVTAVTAKKIRVLAMTIGNNGTATTACQVNSKGAGAGTIVWGPTGIIVDGSLVLPFNKHGWYQSNSGEGLSVTQTGGTVGVNVVYIAV